MIKKVFIIIVASVIAWVAIGLAYLIWYDNTKWNVVLTKGNAQAFFAEINNKLVDDMEATTVFAASNSSKSKNLVFNLWLEDEENKQVRAVLIYLDDFRTTQNVKMSSESPANWGMPKATKKIEQEGFSILHHFPITVINSRVLPKGNSVVVKGISFDDTLKFSNAKFEVAAYFSEIKTIDFSTEPNTGVLRNIPTRFDFFYKHSGSLMFLKNINGQQIAVISYMVNEKDKYNRKTVEFIANHLINFEFSKL